MKVINNNQINQNINSNSSVMVVNYYKSSVKVNPSTITSSTTTTSSITSNENSMNLTNTPISSTTNSITTPTKSSKNMEAVKLSQKKLLLNKTNSFLTSNSSSLSSTPVTTSSLSTLNDNIKLIYIHKEPEEEDEEDEIEVEKEEKVKNPVSKWHENEKKSTISVSKASYPISGLTESEGNESAPGLSEGLTEEAIKNTSEANRHDLDNPVHNPILQKCRHRPQHPILTYDILTRIFAMTDNPQDFAHVCRRWYYVSKDISSKVLWFVKR